MWPWGDSRRWPSVRSRPGRRITQPARLSSGSKHACRNQRSALAWSIPYRLHRLLQLDVALLALQFFLELIEEAPVCALSNDLLRAALNHPHFVEPQRVEADRVFRVVLAPARVGNLPESLRRVGQLSGVPATHDEASRLLWVRGAQIGGLENRPQRPLRRNGVLPYEVSVRADHAAEVLRPRAIRGRAEHQMADPLGAHLLWDRWEAREGVDLAFTE